MANKLVTYIRREFNIGPKPSPRDIGPVTEKKAIKPFEGADGLDYSLLWEAIHKNYLFDWYIEIGCRTGDIFSKVRGKTIAVDPYFQVNTDIIVSKPELHIFQTKSDDFFASNFLKQNNISVSLSFLDGMHLFEYLLRDFINIERNSHPNGVIAMHDCCPRNATMTTRDLENLPEGSWTGDVWKMLPILQKYRPDLNIIVLNCHSTGLVLVSELNPSNLVLSKNYKEIVAAYAAIDLEEFGVKKFYSSFNYIDTQAFLDDGALLFSRVAIAPENEVLPVFVTP